MPGSGPGDPEKTAFFAAFERCQILDSNCVPVTLDAAWRMYVAELEKQDQQGVPAA